MLRRDGLQNTLFQIFHLKNFLMENLGLMISEPDDRGEWLVTKNRRCQNAGPISVIILERQFKAGW